MTHELAEEIKGYRKRLREWLDAPLSDSVKEWRLNELARAFGLRPDTVRRQNFDLNLARWIDDYVQEFPELSPNNPANWDSGLESVDFG